MTLNETTLKLGLKDFNLGRNDFELGQKTLNWDETLNTAFLPISRSRFKQR